MQAGGRYLSSDDAMRVFAAGAAGQAMRVEVDWRSGRRSVVTNVAADTLVTVFEAAAGPVGGRDRGEVPPPWFTDVSRALDHRHREADYDDFIRQPLLPRKLSQLGPSVAWGDLDGDGWEDLVVGGGRGGQVAVYRNDSRGGFEPWRRSAGSGPLALDTAGVLVVPGVGGGAAVVVAESNYEAPGAQPSQVREGGWGEGGMRVWPAGGAALGPLALADLEGDGQLELFVGGRVQAGRYPEPVSSRLWRRTGDGWAEDAGVTALFDRLGMVSGAVFTDLEGDGFPELVVACEWGPLRIFRNRGGTLSPWVPEVFWPGEGVEGQRRGGGRGSFARLDQMSGWWNGVTGGDFDGDGRIDLLASNWGQNTKYEDHRQHPLLLYFGDLAEGGGGDVLEAFYDAGLGKVVPWMHLGRVGAAIPGVGRRYTSFREFGLAGVSEILGARFAEAGQVQATWLESTLFLNRTNGFEVVPLPALAQWAPAFAVAVADFDGDGCEDAFLGQNFFATEPETSRYDGGRGLVLRGDGRGRLRAMEGAESGVLVYGEQRGAAVCDYDADGRTDLVVTQNGALTRLFRNTQGRPGLRVRLQGPPGNPRAVGAAVRVRLADRLGPVREVRAGAGYWSQDSAVVVMGIPESPAAVEVRWPGGGVTSTAVGVGQREVVVAAPGEGLGGRR